MWTSYCFMVISIPFQNFSSRKNKLCRTLKIINLNKCPEASGYPNRENKDTLQVAKTGQTKIPLVITWLYFMMLWLLCKKSEKLYHILKPRIEGRGKLDVTFGTDATEPVNIIFAVPTKKPLTLLWPESADLKSGLGWPWFVSNTGLVAKCLLPLTSRA